MASDLLRFYTVPINNYDSGRARRLFIETTAGRVRHELPLGATVDLDGDEIVVTRWDGRTYAVNQQTGEAKNTAATS